ncbi:hypothetical protein [Bacillus sp. JJ722]|uniref:hypothetical protein n=1 Tax=Bacillus sp. JJ722 TaxID=3122973 RepID=UPI002FFEE5A7
MESNQTNEQQEQTQVETVDKAQYDAVVAELEEVKGKLPVEPTESEIAITQRENELWQKEKNLELKDAQLDKFADFFNATTTDELTSQIKKFQLLLNEVKASTGYIPQDHLKEDTYNQAKENGNTKGMIKSLFGLN